MADKKISQLTGATTPLGGTEEVPLVQGGVTKKVSVANLTAGRSVAAGQLDVDNVRVDGNTISSTNTNGNIVLDPNGSGNVNVVLSAGGQANVNATIFQDTALNLASAAGSTGTQSRITLGDGTYLTGTLSAFGSGYGSGLNYGVMLASNVITNTSLAGSVQYSGPAPATRMFQADGRHYLQYAASGTAGATITWSTAFSTTTTGNLAFPAGQGIDFSANANAPGMTSELLNWYEEGTATAVLTDGTNNATLAAGSGMIYTRIGRLVMVQGYIEVSNIGSVSGALRLAGLPFNVNSSSRSALSVGQSGGLAITAGQSVTGFGQANTDYIRLYVWTATTGSTVMTNTQLSTGGFISFSFNYVVA